MTELPRRSRCPNRLRAQDAIAYTRDRCPLNAQMYAQRTKEAMKTTTYCAGVSPAMSYDDCAVLLPMHSKPTTETVNHEEEK